MKDPRDKQTGDLLRSPGAGRQAAYAARQRAAGRRQRSMWLTDDEATVVSALLEQMRGSAEALEGLLEQMRGTDDE